MTNSGQLDVNESDICNVQIPLIPLHTCFCIEWMTETRATIPDHEMEDAYWGRQSNEIKPRINLLTAHPDLFMSERGFYLV